MNTVLNDFKIHISLVAASILALLFTAGCEQSFSPIKDSNYNFSIFGYLDAAADTQWVRVTPVRDSLFVGTDRIEATVTLDHMGNGESVTLNDSLFQYGQDGYAWNFWTAAELEPEKSYLLTAGWAGEETSNVVVTLPEDYPTPVVRKIGGTRHIVEIENVEHLAYVNILYQVKIGGRVVFISVPQIQNATITSTGSRVSISEINDQRYIKRQLGGDVTLLNRQVVVAATGDLDWPDFSNIDPTIEALPDGISNIKNGVGFAAGIISKTFPLKSCFDDNGQLAPCPLEERMRCRTYGCTQ